MDFLSWHEYYSEPALEDETAVAMIRSWLIQFGFNNTALFIDEWNSERRDDHTNAAYAIASLCNMVKNKIDGQMFFTLGDDPRTGKVFSNDFGMLTSQGIKKAVFYAFKMFSLMQGEIIASKSNRQNIYVLSSKTEDTMYILICNYLGSLRHRLVKHLKQKGYSREDFKKYGLSRQVVTDVIKKKGEIDNLSIPDKLKLDIKDILEKLNEQASLKETTVQLHIKNIPFEGEFQYRKYLIDVEHSNSFALKDKIIEFLGATKSVQANNAEDINNMPGVELDVLESRVLEANKSFNEVLDLEPYSATLIVLKK